MHLRRLALGVACLLIVAAMAAPSASARSSAGMGAQRVVTTYFGILNAGLKSGDFAALATVYAPDATLTQSNPLGVTKVFHGLAAITAYYQGFAKTFPGLAFTQQSMRTVGVGVVLSYERAATATQAVPGRCAHLFAVENGKITTMDWVTYYGGK